MESSRNGEFPKWRVPEMESSRNGELPFPSLPFQSKGVNLPAHALGLHNSVSVSKSLASKVSEPCKCQ